MITISTEKCTKEFSKKVIEFILISLPLFYSKQKKNYQRIFEMFFCAIFEGRVKCTQSITIYESPD